MGSGVKAGRPLLRLAAILALVGSTRLIARGVMRRVGAGLRTALSGALLVAGLGTSGLSMGLLMVLRRVMARLFLAALLSQQVRVGGGA